jgi:hypothetical protein
MQAVKFAEKIVTSTARKPKPAPGVFKTSALESARRFGIVGAYSGPPDLAANRKRYARAKAHGKAGAAR